VTKREAACGNKTIEMFIEETRKFMAERHKLMAEASKFRIERWLIPVTVIAGALFAFTASYAAVKALLH
jgi:hypothetical protein